MLAADVARLSFHPADATRYLSRVANGFPGDKRAPLAAFTLGRVLLEDLGQPARAADAFRRAQQLAPRGPLASDALAREVEAARRSGQHERAKQVALRYLELYPDGPQAERLRKQ
jgi:transmembrane sensor